jgi:hypothetical protein
VKRTYQPSRFSAQPCGFRSLADNTRTVNAEAYSLRAIRAKGLKLTA